VAGWCSGQQAIPTDPDGIAAQVAVASIRQALVETDLAEPATVRPRALVRLAAAAETVWDLRLQCDYAGAGRLLPGLLRELHAATHGRDRVSALRLLARTADVASFLTRYIGSRPSRGLRRSGPTTRRRHLKIR
jgi:hypothetical protein